MKYKNYKSAIHNFVHSFTSIDYMKSGRLALNVLIELHNAGIESKATFDFINKSIKPTDAAYMESQQLMNDYLDWLPEHFKNHNCDLTKLEKLEITYWTDFKNTLPYERNQNDRILKVIAKTKWKADGRNEEVIEISQSDLIPKKILELEHIPKLPELN
ncbi:hypothetical protein GSB9_03187 [Flavobacteriaceae bacterium GSB9]|nr:hypothetical protein GSB9_03187 [Flavobacteriaceae bacterium GSB9]